MSERAAGLRNLLAALSLSVGCSGDPRANPPAEADAADAADDSVDTGARDTTPVESVRPPKPTSLVSYQVGNDADRVAMPTGGLILMGGGADVDAAFAWWKPRLDGGDVVVLRADDRAGYGPYLYDEIGGCESVETLVVTTRALANDPYVAWTVAHAEGIFIAGGDQAEYLRTFRGTALEGAIAAAAKRGAIVGGTSAGCAVLGDVAYAAYEKGATSSEALGDPYHVNVTLEPEFLTFGALDDVVTDTHFATRDRMGRLAAFVARAQHDGLVAVGRGLGIDEATALVIDGAGLGTVVGTGRVYALRTRSITSCTKSTPLDATFELHQLEAGDTLQLPAFTTSSAPIELSARKGSLTPTNPY